MQGFPGIRLVVHPEYLYGCKSTQDVIVSCFQLNAIMTAMDVTMIDYFSLDAQRDEQAVLETIDWTRLTIDIITVESGVAGVTDARTLEYVDKLRPFFAKTGI